MVNAREILDFWFKQTPPERWFSSDPEFDTLIRGKFAEAWQSAREAGASQGSSVAESLTLILLFDQFSRNKFRGTAEAHATDALAREVARAAVGTWF